MRVFTRERDNPTCYSRMLGRVQGSAALHLRLEPAGHRPGAIPFTPGAVAPGVTLSRVLVSPAAGAPRHVLFPGALRLLRSALHGGHLGDEERLPGLFVGGVLRAAAAVTQPVGPEADGLATPEADGRGRGRGGHLGVAAETTAIFDIDEDGDDEDEEDTDDSDSDHISRRHTRYGHALLFIPL